jgi:hypothetical protein
MSSKSVNRSDVIRLRQMELSLSICRDALKAIAANGDLHSSWSARKALNNVDSTFRRANV